MSDFQLANPQKFAAIAIVREPGAIPGVEPMHRIYEELLLRFHRILEINRDRGLVIADKSRHESRVQPVVANWQQGSGTRFGKLHRIMEVPLFLDSAMSRLTQLADLVAHATFLAYERKDANLLDLLLPSFPVDRSDGKMHTLVHLTGSVLTCSCPACASRRNEKPEGSMPTPGPGQLELFH